MSATDLTTHIRSNPITKYRVNYSDKLIEKIQSQFTTDEQQLFVYNFYGYLNYNSTDFIVDLDKVWEFIGFTTKGNSKKALKHLIENTDYRITHPYKQEGANGSGANRECIELTITAFKTLCLSANTEKSKQIINYYIKLEDILNQCLAESTGFNSNADAILALETAESAKLKEQLFVANNALKTTKEAERHNVLLETFKNTSPIVYIIRVKSFDGGRYIVKIGESRKGLKARYDEHRLKYDECVILDCYEVLDSKVFESFLHNHPDIRPHIVRNLAGHEKENELFMVGDGLTYAAIIKIIDAEMHKFNKRTAELHLENELLKAQADVRALQTPQSVLQSDMDAMNTRLDDLTGKVNNLHNMMLKIMEQNQMILNNQAARPVPLTTASGTENKTLGPRLQQIDPITLQIVKVYDTFSECVTTFNAAMHRYALGQHIQKNTTYMGYRWRYVERDLDPTIIHGDILPTQESKERCIDYVVKMDINKSRIIAVYINRKTAALANGYSATGLDNAISKDVVTKGYRYTSWEKCPESLTAPFEEKYGPVVLYENGVAQYKADTLVTEYSTKYECYHANNFGEKTMRKLLDSGAEYEGHHYVAVTNKLFMGEV